MPRKYNLKKKHWTQTPSGRARLKAAALSRRRTSLVTPTGRRGMREPQASTRLELLREALTSIPFGFTIFFTDERGESIKYYQGAVVQEEAR